MASTGNLAFRGAQRGARLPHPISVGTHILASSPVLRFYFPGHLNAAMCFIFIC